METPEINMNAKATVKAFLKDRCETGIAYSEKACVLWDAFTEWIVGKPIPPAWWSVTRFGKTLVSVGARKYRARGGVVYLGFHLKS